MYARKARYEEVYLTNRALKRQRPSGSPAIISFGKEDRENVLYPHDDTLVITLLIANFKIRQVMVDNRSSVDILF